MSKSTTNQLSKFVQATIAFITGDTDTAIALKNERQSRSAIKGQISALEGALINAETKVEAAEEALEKAIHPTALITDHSVYYRSVIKAQQALDDANIELQEVVASKEYAEELLRTKF